MSYADVDAGKPLNVTTPQVFAPGIGIEDDMSVMVRYNTGATLTYHLVSLFVSILILNRH